MAVYPIADTDNNIYMTSQCVHVHIDRLNIVYNLSILGGYFFNIETGPILYS